jgi:putative peptidoglycan lipid II flippase
MKKFLVLLAPLLIGIVAAKYRDIVTKGTFGSFLPSGQLSAIDWAKRVGDFPTQVLPYALSIAMFPFLCEMAREKDYKQFGSVVTRTLKLLALFFVPLTVATIVLRQPIIQFVYQLGNWTDVNTAWTSLALGCYVTALIFYASEMVIMQSFFSMQNTWIPVSVGLAASFLQVAGLYAAVNFLGLNRFYCVALAFPISRAIKNIVLIGLMKQKIPILPAGETTKFAGKLALIAAGVGCAMYVADLFAGPLFTLAIDSRGFLNPRVGARLTIVSLAGAGTFVALCFALRMEEARIVVNWLKTEGWDRIRARLGHK